MKTIRQIKNLRGKKVLLRIDANVPLQNGKLVAEGVFRIESILPTIAYLCEKGARVIIVTHLGRPMGKRVKRLSVAPIVAYLAKKLKKKIPLVENIVKAGLLIDTMKEGEIMCGENIRFYKEEDVNDSEFAQKLGKLADVYVNDAFAVCHRFASSTVAITQFLPSYAGFQLEKEIAMLRIVKLRAKKPLVVVVGGAKIETKVPLIKTLAPHALAVLTGGMIGVALCTDAPAHLWQKEFKSIRVPIDGIVGNKNGGVVLGGCSRRMGDIGPATIEEYMRIIATAKTIIWNGPVGQFEKKEFSKGTKAIARAISKSKAFSVVGGGETVEAIIRYKLQNNYSFVSTGGGAMLAFLGGEPMPGIEALS